MTELVHVEAVDGRARGLRGGRAGDRAGPLELVRRVDLLLLGAVLGAVAYGLYAIDGITKLDPGGSALGRQALYAAVGLVLMAAAVFVDPRLYRRFAGVIYVGLLAGMGLVLATGAVTRGSRRWIDVGFFRFQPSEFGKLLIALFLAAFLADRAKRVHELRVAIQAILLAAGPVLLVFVQPDIGTALVYGAVLAAALFVAGVRWAHLAAIGAVALLATLAVLWWLPASGVNVLKPYQAQRLTGVFHPSADPQGATYNVNQSITTVGAGGFRGRGIQGATQTRLDYIPEHGTDFAFASLAEQRGFVGASLLLLLYLLVVWRGLRAVTGAGDLFGAIVAGGISFAFLFQVYVNVGMTIGIAPITGIPLPFVSVGGSSMIANLAAMGILQAVHVRGRRRR
ncbi:MAG TPA: rod shape-determining protein RodA [Gaiellaceae bacterium]|nr:rod shape-determining protein RodA [Gaiellaceae bacterium]